MIGKESTKHRKVKIVGTSKLNEDRKDTQIR